VFVLNLDTGRGQQLTDNEVADVQPNWSPDGQRIVFVRAERVTDLPDRASLMLISPNGGSERVVLECSSLCGLPAWSPDGQVIAFEMEAAIWTVRSDGSDLRKVSGEKVAEARDPTWSPDGHRVAYWASLDASDISRPKQGDLAAIDLTTGEETIGAILGACGACAANVARSRSFVRPWEPLWGASGWRCRDRASLL
jgi:Tol biopolymer transport system component